MSKKITLENLAEKMDKGFKRAEKHTDKKIDEKIDGLALAVAKGFQGVDKKIEAVDKKFEKVDERFDKVDKTFLKLPNIFATKDDLSEAVKNLSTKEDFNKLLNSVDAYAKKADKYFQEMLMLANKVDRHERWIFQIAERLEIKLEY